MRKIIFSLLCFLCLPIISLAANYNITNYYIKANINDNGDMDVSELLVLHGTFNGYERDLVYKNSSSDSIYNASDITNLEIYSGSVTNVSMATFDQDFDLSTEDYSAVSGDRNKYILSNIEGGIRARMYYRTDSASTAFLIKYTLKDVMILHNDCAEIYWNFIGTGFEDSIRDLQIEVTYPEKLELDDFNWWFHGDLTGNSHYDNSGDTTKVIASVNHIYAGSAVDFRTLIPKDAVLSSSITKKTSEDVRKSIIAHEDEIVANDLKLIKRNKILYYVFYVLTICYFICLVLAWIYAYRKYDKERKPKFNLEYNREFIDDYSVEDIDYLMHKNITPNAMSASIMNLIYKKNIKAEKLPDKKNNFKFTLLSSENVTASEASLIKFLFEEVGSNGEFTSSSLKAYASSTSTCDSFMSEYNIWKNKVLNDAKSQGFYDTLSGKIKPGFIMLFIAFVIYFFGRLVFNVQIFLMNFLFVGAAIFIIYLGTISKRSERGAEDYAKWKAFKKFLNDFGDFSVKDLPEIILWERYLVYATIFGLASKVQKAMNVKIQEIDTSTYGGNVYMFNDINIAPMISSSINSAYTGAQNAINRNSIEASGGSFGGHGGGFSSGGGFGGGGGGGRGF